MPYAQGLTVAVNLTYMACSHQDCWVHGGESVGHAPPVSLTVPVEQHDSVYTYLELVPSSLAAQAAAAGEASFASDQWVLPPDDTLPDDRGGSGGGSSGAANAMKRVVMVLFGALLALVLGGLMIAVLDAKTHPDGGIRRLMSLLSQRRRDAPNSKNSGKPVLRSINSYARSMSFTHSSLCSPMWGGEDPLGRLDGQNDSQRAPSGGISSQGDAPGLESIPSASRIRYGVEPDKLTGRCVWLIDLIAPQCPAGTLCNA